MDKNIILLIDLGFYKYQLFSRIVENGGYFVSRLKSKSNPLIVGVNHVRNCCDIDLNRKYLKDIKLEKSDDIFDVNVEVSFDRRSYREESKTDSKIFRSVAIYNPEFESMNVVPPETIIPLTVYVASPKAGMSILGPMIQNGSLSEAKALIVLMLGSMFMLPFIAIRSEMSNYTSLFGMRRGISLVAISTAISMIVRFTALCLLLMIT